MPASAPGRSVRTIPSGRRPGQPVAGRAGMPPFPRRIRRVNRMALRAAVSPVECPRSPIRLIKPREIMHRTISCQVFAALPGRHRFALSMPARAQIGTIFSDPRRGPPGSIPRRRRAETAPDEEEEVPELPPRAACCRRARSAAADRQGNVLPGPVQPQPLAPPPGSSVAPQNQSPSVAAAPPQQGAGRRSPRHPGPQRQPEQKGGRQPGRGAAGAAQPAAGR